MDAATIRESGYNLDLHNPHRPDDLEHRSRAEGRVRQDDVHARAAHLGSSPTFREFCSVKFGRSMPCRSRFICASRCGIGFFSMPRSPAFTCSTSDADTFPLVEDRHGVHLVAVGELDLVTWSTSWRS